MQIRSIAICVLLVLVEYGLACHTFAPNTTIAIRLYGKTYNRNATVSGCIDRINLGDKLPEEVNITEQQVPALGKDAFRNLSRLKILRIDACHLQSIHPEAFRNTPRLTEVHISNNQFDTLPADVFNRGTIVEVLALNNNGIRQVGGFRNMDRLGKLKMRHNELPAIESSWFVNCTNLRILDLSFNRITSLGRRTFDHLRRLKQLHLDDNLIGGIEPKTFEKMSSLKVLSLRHNRILELNADILGNGKLNLEQLIVSANRLNFIGQDVMRRITVKILKIDGNPIKCNCLEAIGAWLRAVDGSFAISTGCEIPTMPACVYPKILSLNCTETNDEFGMTNFYKTANKIIDKNHLSCAWLD